MFKKELKIIVITQDDPFYICEFFKPFLKKTAKLPINILFIAISDPFNESFFSLMRRMFRFYGVVDFVCLGLRYVILKAADQIGLGIHSIKRLASQYGIQVKKIKDVNSPGFIEYIKSLSPDVILSVSAPQIFKEALLKVPKWGCINVHSAKLPMYRGMMPNFWAMYHGDSTAGITVHTMDTQIDRGKIILQKEIPIYPKESLDSLIKRSKREGAELVIQALENIGKGNVELRDYEGGGSYFPFPDRRHVKRFRAKGYSLL